MDDLLVQRCFGPDVNPVKPMPPIMQPNTPSAPSAPPAPPVPSAPSSIAPPVPLSPSTTTSTVSTPMKTSAESLRTRTPQHGEENGKLFKPAPRQASSKKLKEKQDIALKNATFLLEESIKLVLGLSTETLNNDSTQLWPIPDKVGYDAIVLMCDPELRVDEIASTLEDDVTYGDMILGVPSLQLCITAALGIGSIMGAATRSTNDSSNDLESSQQHEEETKSTNVRNFSSSSSSSPFSSSPSKQMKTSASWDPIKTKKSGSTSKNKQHFDEEVDKISIINGIILCGQAMSTSQFVCGLPRMGEYAYNMEEMIGKPKRHRLKESSLSCILKELTSRMAVPRYIDVWLDILHVQCKVDESKVDESKSSSCDNRSDVLQEFVLGGKYFCDLNRCLIITLETFERKNCF